MAPVTRRKARAQKESNTEEVIITTSVTENGAGESSHELSFEEPIALRSKRKSSGSAEGEDQHGAEEVEQTTPKRKKLEVRIRDDVAPSTGRKTQIEVVIPSSALKTPHSRSSPIPDSQETGASDDEKKEPFEPQSASKQLEEEASQKLALQSQSVEPKPEPTPQPKAARSTHVVFGDDDDVDKFVAAAVEKEADAQQANVAGEAEENESDDDEAPEAVSTAAAAQETLRSAKAAIDAAEKYAALVKRKRQERDGLLRQQAEKRKRTQKTKPSTSDKDASSPDEDEEEDKEEERSTAKRQRRSENLPNMLPAEFLTDSSEDEGDEAALKKMVKRPQKITFETAMQVLDVEGKRPRDEVVGSTRYRVLAEQGDQRLAPKANKQSRRIKEDLLRRGRIGVMPNKKKGFFVRR
ncbi:hypothetical protein F5Y19DRAFT_450735 [Xylariaceae sp. FL1651]|nr:hypothetical protein F5Y19DRAFT_450735 [Xylariaceae sp. FL1651]